MILNIQRTLQITGIIIALLMVLSLFAVSRSSAYDPLGRACRTNPTASACQDRPTTTTNPLVGPDGLITKATRLVAALVGVASVVMIILGGYTYVTSTGDPQKTKAAKDTILYAIIGLVIAATAGLLIGFILSKIK